MAMWEFAVKLLAMTLVFTSLAYAGMEFLREPALHPSMASLIALAMAWKLTAAPSATATARETEMKRRAKPRECYKCNKPNPGLRCSKCKVAFYCNVECQAEDWDLHKVNCVSFIETARMRDEIITTAKNFLDEVNAKKKG